MIDRFFRPFLGGIFLESELRTSSRMLDFVFRTFANGEATLPEEGMQAIPRQVCSRLAPENVILGAKVMEINGTELILESGEKLQAQNVVVAVEGPTASKLLNLPFENRSRKVCCLYFAAKELPIEEPILVLNGERTGLVNNLCVPSQVQSSYAPQGEHLISVTVLGDPTLSNEELRQSVTRELTEWFGAQVEKWQYLKTYRIAMALPEQEPPALSPPQRPIRIQPNLFVCGDHRDNASINGSIQSGHRTADVLVKELTS